MNTAAQVDQLATDLKNHGVPLADVAWRVALACVGWAYVYGAAGEYCDPENRRSYYARKGKDHPTIKSSCHVLCGKKDDCSGCKFYPGGKTRFFDCRGFTRWILKKVYGWTLQGGGCTSQWNNADNWKAKGKISDGFPQNTLVCLFYSKDGKERTWEHTGFGLNNETVECQVGVQYFKTRNKKWTHWAVPQCVEGEVKPVPVPETKPTLRRGSNGQYVTTLQVALVNRGYNIGSAGVDGNYGRGTEAAVKEFQRDNGLNPDGICGPMTWTALDNSPTAPKYTVKIPGLNKAKAEELVSQYIGATMEVEG